MTKTLLVTGSSGLVGSEVCAYFAGRGWKVYGMDNNARRDFFGPQGDASWNLSRMKLELPNFQHFNVDVRNRQSVLELLENLMPTAIVHAAAQPSHDLAAKIPFDDFDTNATGTLNMLEATRRYQPDAVFVFMSTNKVYGAAPNELPLVETPTRWDYARSEDFSGIAEDCRVDFSTHSLFGASKLAADVMVQEYGRYFGMKTCCLRGGCLTGPNQSGVELHGFLSYLIKCNLTQQKYTVFGHKGKQVRDNIHSFDVARFIDAFIEAPRCAEVYNLGGGRQNSCSILEAIDMAEAVSNQKLAYEYLDTARVGDHVCYISNLDKMKLHYPGWNITKDLHRIFEEIHVCWRTRIG